MKFGRSQTSHFPRPDNGITFFYISTLSIFHPSVKVTLKRHCQWDLLRLLAAKRKTLTDLDAAPISL